MTFDKATFEDCKEVYDLICDMEKKTLPYDRFSDIFRSQTEDEHYYCVVCRIEGKIVGELNLRFEEQLHHCERIAEIMEFAVNPNYRSQGIGKQTLQYACQVAKDHGCSQLEVACNQLRTNTHRFYLREQMNNFHFKFSKSLNGNDVKENQLGR